MTRFRKRRKTVVVRFAEHEADMVVGSRVLGAYERESHIRHAGVFVLSGLVSLLHGVRVTDDVSPWLGVRSCELGLRLPGSWSRA